MISKPAADCYTALEWPDWWVTVDYGPEHLTVSLDNVHGVGVDLDRPQLVRLVDALIRALSGDHPFTIDEG